LNATRFRVAAARKFLIRTVAMAAVIAASSLVPIAAASAAPASGNIAPGTSIGSAWPPLQGGVVYTESNQFSSFPEDWYVLYKTPDSNTATITIDNTTTSQTSSCGYINVALQDNNGWADGAINQATLADGGSVTFTIPASRSGDPQGIYYVWVTGNSSACNSSGSATYTMELSPDTEFTNPARVPSQTGTPGTSIGNAWPPLHGGINYTQTNFFAGWPEDWYPIYKKPDSHIATIRIVNTTVEGTGCPYLNVYLQDNNGWADGAVAQATLNANSAVTFTVPASLSSDPQGLYYVWVTGNSSACNSSGGATYTIEPEPSTEFTSPARVPSQTGTPGTSIGNAWPPLRPGIAFAHTNRFSGFPEDWYSVYKTRDSRAATIRVVNTTVNGTGCPYLNVFLLDNHGTADGAIAQATLNANSAVTFHVPGTLAGDAQGLYYVTLTGNSSACNSSGAASYTVELEPAAEWGTFARALPYGPSRKVAAGPLAGAVNYSAVLPTAGMQEWAYFTTKGAATVRVADTSASTAGCKLDVLAGSVSAAFNAGQIASLHVTRAGTYVLELTPAAGCHPKSPLSALIELAGSVRGPVLTITDPTLKAGPVRKPYSATIVVAGGKKPYVFAAITALPPGLSLNKKTGVISGRPAKAGSYTVMVTVTDAARPAHDTTTVPVKITITG
jgi:hypothetical protein